MPETPVDRRQFSVAAALALLGGASITIGCGGGSRSPTTPAPVQTRNPAPAPTPVLPPGAVAGSVSANHPAPHRAVITAAELGAGGALTLNILGDAFHSHTVTLANTEVGEIARGARVAKQSSQDPHSDGSGPHSHTVTFN